MKSLLSALLILTAGASFAHASDDFCSTAQAYQPGGSDPVYAVDVFAIEMKLSACNLRSVLRLTDKQSLYIRAYDSETRTFRYEIVDFTASTPMEKTCTISSRLVSDPNGAWDAQREVFSAPVCTTPIVAR